MFCVVCSGDILMFSLWMVFMMKFIGFFILLCYMLWEKKRWEWRIVLMVFLMCRLEVCSWVVSVVMCVCVGLGWMKNVSSFCVRNCGYVLVVSVVWSMFLFLSFLCVLSIVFFFGLCWELLKENEFWMIFYFVNVCVVFFMFCLLYEFCLSVKSLKSLWVKFLFGFFFVLELLLSYWSIVGLWLILSIRGWKCFVLDC